MIEDNRNYLKQIDEYLEYVRIMNVKQYMIDEVQKRIGIFEILCNNINIKDEIFMTRKNKGWQLCLGFLTPTINKSIINRVCICEIMIEENNEIELLEAKPYGCSKYELKVLFHNDILNFFKYVIESQST